MTGNVRKNSCQNNCVKFHNICNGGFCSAIVGDMETGRARVYDTPPSGAIVDDTPGTGDALLLLTPQESIFVAHYAESRNHYAAYRTAYPIDQGASNSTVYRRACEVLRRAHVIAAIGVLRDQMNAQTLVRATDLMRDLVDIVDANPNELIKLEKFNCRHCHGVDHAYQWTDPAELARAMDAYMIASAKPSKKGAPQPRMPDPSGGFGFAMRGDPAPECPHCLGEGFTRVTPMDTTKLSPQARKLFKGVRQKADGSIEILMHDQMQARDMLIKMLGAYKDPKQVAPPTPGGQGALEMPKDATPEDAQRTYLALIKS